MGEPPFVPKSMEGTGEGGHTQRAAPKRITHGRGGGEAGGGGFIFFWGGGGGGAGGPQPGFLFEGLDTG